MESNNESLKNQLARLQQDLRVRFTDNDGNESSSSDHLDELAREIEIEEFDELAELNPQIQPESEHPPEDPSASALAEP